VGKHQEKERRDNHGTSEKRQGKGEENIGENEMENNRNIESTVSTRLCLFQHSPVAHAVAKKERKEKRRNKQREV
jgi:hypothetical protein